MDVALARAWLDAAAAAIAARGDELTRLDAAIGDSDHGVNMNRGFGAVTAKASPRTITSCIDDTRCLSGRNSETVRSH
ncbi:hypothetical protein AB0J67_27570, partial [Catellatospora sp. NPDC049609]